MSPGGSAWNNLYVPSFRLHLDAAHLDIVGHPMVYGILKASELNLPTMWKKINIMCGGMSKSRKDVK